MPFARARAAILLLFAAAAIAAAWYWVRLGVPVDLVAAPTGRIACVSYAPYRKAGESPFTRGYRVTAARIDEDLRALSRRFDCVRTYSVGQGLDQVPAIARRYGMKVLLGAWLSRNPVENAEELTHAIEIATRERDVIRAIVVGNEVLLRGELPQRTIAEHLRMVKAATGLPVTYADVWEFWLKYREVAPAVDFITIHILPYWEDEPVAIENAIPHVDAIYRRMQAAFPGRDFLIGETGWPERGAAALARGAEPRQRGALLPRVHDVRRSGAPALQRDRGVRPAVEARARRDCRRLLGAVRRRPERQVRLLRPGRRGAALVGRARGRRAAGGAVRAALAGAASGLAGGLAARALAGFTIGAVASHRSGHIVFANRNALEWATTSAATLLAVVTAVLVCERVAAWLDDARRDAGGLAVATMAAALTRGAGAPPSRRSRVDGVLQAAWLIVVTIVDLLLIYDARYRDFPSLLVAPVVMGYAALALTRTGVAWRARREVEERYLAIGLVVAAALLLVFELPINASADVWAFLCVAFAVATWVNAAPLLPTAAPVARGFAPAPARRA